MIERPLRIVDTLLFDYFDLFHGLIAIRPGHEVSQNFYVEYNHSFDEPWEFGSAVFVVGIHTPNLEPQLLECWVNGMCIGGQYVVSVSSSRSFVYYDLPTPPLMKGRDNIITLRNSGNHTIKIERVDLWIAIKKKSMARRSLFYLLGKLILNSWRIR